jgi:putative membrane protein
MEMKRWIFGVLIGSLVAMSCDNDDDNKQSLAQTDKTFVEGAALSNMTEVDFGNLALTKGSSEMVRDFAEHMIMEHTQAQTELRTLANNYGNVNWPNEMDAQHKQIKQQLEAMSGHQFDSMYMASQVNDHQMTLNMFQTEISSGTVQSVKSYATKYLPNIQMHFQRADSIKSALDAMPQQGRINP